MHAYVRVPKTLSALYVPARHEVFTKSLTHTRSFRIQKPQPTDTIWRAKRENGRRGGLKKYKSLPLFRLVAAVVCCLVFPLWVN